MIDTYFFYNFFSPPPLTLIWFPSDDFLRFSLGNAAAICSASLPCAGLAPLPLFLTLTCKLLFQALLFTEP